MMPLGSRVTPVCREKSNVVSTTISDCRKASSTLPCSTVLVQNKLFPSSSCITIASLFKAVSISTCASFSNHSTSIASIASSACALEFAITTATASPCHLTVFAAKGDCSGDLISPKCPNVPTQGVQILSISSAIKTSIIPGKLLASVTSIDRISACAKGDLKKAIFTILGRVKSSTNCPPPSKCFLASSLDRLLPIYELGLSTEPNFGF